MEQNLVINSTASEKYMRIASISIAFYDYILTLPAEWRFYRSQSSIFHMSLSCVLLILIRYVSIVTIVTSNYGYFSSHFTQQACQQYYLVAPIFKVVQTMISQAILGVRTFNVARRDRRIGIALLLIYFFLVLVEWFTNIFGRAPVVIDRSCTPADAGRTLSTWFFYLAPMLYDIVMVTISTKHLLHYNPLSSRVERLIRVLIYDGVGYFLVLSVSNILNLILYHTTDFQTQSAGASMGYAVTWIMSQRILIHIREMTELDPQHLENVVIARPTLTARAKMTSGLRSQFESKSQSKNLKNSRDADFAPTSPRSGNANTMELGIRVRVERSVVQNHTPADESDRSSLWETKGIGAEQES
ncbi:hypothetical protein DFJ58DRAFT_746359 [Suillus subalutaceus]|uniref:uncharacterized protein n=1 Tax=Suillus subalutaceus TaxID=48586 RepID=UPI001B883CFA|nr:uncharacterized protein DFJ58DRAFT_746359 [Suillus subalutaceus]KAG1850796.1 hypothetical protein DFJ58DRAFT_746359 [Suillus subalutaceus]